jgi:hypothetical protein
MGKREDYISKMGYRDDSPFNNRKFIDINTPNGVIDMSKSGRTLRATDSQGNTKILKPYSGQHQFAPGIVREEPIDEEEYEEGLPKYQTRGEVGRSNFLNVTPEEKENAFNYIQELKAKEVQRNLQDAKTIKVQQFLSNMTRSPLFEERMKKQTGKTPWAGQADNYAKRIRNNIKTLKYRDFNDPKQQSNIAAEFKDETIKPAAYYSPRGSDLWDWTDEMLYAGGYGNIHYQDDVANEHKVTIPYGNDYEDALAVHETSHGSTNANINLPIRPEGMPEMNSEAQDLYNTLGGGKEWIDYYHDPTEQKARVDVIRYELKKAGIYDAFNEPFTEDTYLKAKKHALSLPWSHLRSNMLDILQHYKKDDAVELMNSFVQNETENEGSIPTAQLGSEYEEKELTDEEIKELRDGGYVVDELPQAHYGGDLPEHYHPHMNDPSKEQYYSTLEEKFANEKQNWNNYLDHPFYQENAQTSWGDDAALNIQKQKDRIDKLDIGYENDYFMDRIHGSAVKGVFQTPKEEGGRANITMRKSPGSNELHTIGHEIGHGTDMSPETIEGSAYKKAMYPEFSGYYPENLSLNSGYTKYYDPNNKGDPEFKKYLEDPTEFRTRLSHTKGLMIEDNFNWNEKSGEEISEWLEQNNNNDYSGRNGRMLDADALGEVDQISKYNYIKPIKYSDFMGDDYKDYANEDWRKAKGKDGNKVYKKAWKKGIRTPEQWWDRFQTNFNDDPELKKQFLEDKDGDGEPDLQLQKSLDTYGPEQDPKFLEHVFKKLAQEETSPDQGDLPMAQNGGPKVKQRRGVRDNYDYKAWTPSGLQFPTSVSSHLMSAEEVDGNWVGFPNLFQDSKPYANDQENWKEVSGENGWWPIYQEAVRRGEVYDFGEDKEAALAFGRGSWKDQLPEHLQDKQEGGQLPKAQEGIEPTRADSLFLLNNNKVIEDLQSSGWEKGRNEMNGGKASHYGVPTTANWKEYYDFKVKRRKGKIQDEMDEYKTNPHDIVKKSGTMSDYYSDKGLFKGATDWLSGGGDDKDFAMQYIHPSIKPQYAGEMYAPNNEIGAVYSYAYDDLAITPWDMLSAKDKEKRLDLYGTTGTPYTDKPERSTSSIAREKKRDETETLMRELRDKGLYDGPIRGRGAEDNEEWQKAIGNVEEAPALEEVEQIEKVQRDVEQIKKVQPEADTTKKGTHLESAPIITGYRYNKQTGKSEPVYEDSYYRVPNTRIDGQPYDPSYKQIGGEYEEQELTDFEIAKLRKGGYVVEELPQAQLGFNGTLEPITLDNNPTDNMDPSGSGMNIDIEGIRNNLPPFIRDYVHYKDLQDAYFWEKNQENNKPELTYGNPNSMSKGGELPTAQEGITVSDLNDPRLTSYIDSLDLYNLSNDFKNRVQGLVGIDATDPRDMRLLNKPLTSEQLKNSYKLPSNPNISVFGNWDKDHNPTRDLMGEAVHVEFKHPTIQPTGLYTPHQTWTKWLTGSGPEYSAFNITYPKPKREVRYEPEIEEEEVEEKVEEETPKPRSESSLARGLVREQTEDLMKNLKAQGLYDGPIRGRGADENEEWQKALEKYESKDVSVNKNIAGSTPKTLKKFIEPKTPEGYTLKTGYRGRDNIYYGNKYLPTTSKGKTHPIPGAPTMQDYWIKYPNERPKDKDLVSKQIGGALPKAQIGNGEWNEYTMSLNSPEAWSKKIGYTEQNNPENTQQVLKEYAMWRKANPWVHDNKKPKDPWDINEYQAVPRFQDGGNKDSEWAARIRAGLGPEYANYNDQQIRAFYDHGSIMTSFGEDSYVAPQLDEVTITSETDKERRDAEEAKMIKYFREENILTKYWDTKEKFKDLGMGALETIGKVASIPQAAGVMNFKSNTLGQRPESFNDFKDALWNKQKTPSDVVDSFGPNNMTDEARFALNFGMDPAWLMGSGIGKGAGAVSKLASKGLKGAKAVTKKLASKVDNVSKKRYTNASKNAKFFDDFERNVDDVYNKGPEATLYDDVATTASFSDEIVETIARDKDIIKETRRLRAEDDLLADPFLDADMLDEGLTVMRNENKVVSNKKTLERIEADRAVANVTAHAPPTPVTVRHSDGTRTLSNERRLARKEAEEMADDISAKEATASTASEPTIVTEYNADGTTSQRVIGRPNRPLVREEPNPVYIGRDPVTGEERNLWNDMQEMDLPETNPVPLGSETRVANNVHLERLVTEQEAKIWIETWENNFGNLTQETALKNFSGESLASLELALENGTMQPLEAVNHLRDALRSHTNNFHNWRPKKIPKPKAVLNGSGKTKEEVLKMASGEDKAIIDKMSEADFMDTVITPSGKIQKGSRTSKANYKPSETGMIDDAIPMSNSEYSQKFNNGVDRLNQIIKENNHTGVEYYVSSISETGKITLITPKQILANGTEIQYSTRVWSTRIKAGSWEGKVRNDVFDKNYYTSIPGLSMTDTMAGVFGDGVHRAGSGAYKSINQYLKEMSLGRVKAGFNSQSPTGFKAWDNLVKKGYAQGHYAKPSFGKEVVHGVFFLDGGEYNEQELSDIEIAQLRAQGYEVEVI